MKTQTKYYFEYSRYRGNSGGGKIKVSPQKFINKRGLTDVGEWRPKGKIFDMDDSGQIAFGKTKLIARNRAYAYQAKMEKEFGE